MEIIFPIGKFFHIEVPFYLHGNFARIVNIREMPGYNSSIINGINSVSQGLVWWDGENKATCIYHGAMNCVSQDRKIWRCLMCNEGCYVLQLQEFIHRDWFAKHL